MNKPDEEFQSILGREVTRQQAQLSMIPSENFFSKNVRAAVGSVFMHKYSEGNIGQRYYEGCEYIDELEQLAIARAKQVFELPDDWGVNVQALSGSNANLASYLASLQPGDTIMSMYLPDGGHLSHGWSYEPGGAANPEEPVYKGGSRKVNIVSQLYKVIQYKTDPKTQVFDYDELEQIAKQYQPKMLVSGGTAYPRLIDHARMRQIADSVGALYLADIAHEAGLIAAGVMPSPVGIADIVTMTTHKTLRAGRGAIILARGDLIGKINKAVLPGLQGGPHNHNIAGICVGLGEALQPEFKKYAQQVLQNAKAFAGRLSEHGFSLVSGGVDKHLILIDLHNQPILGKKFAKALARVGIIANYNTMPGETRPPTDPSAIRFGTPWLTTRGMKEPELEQIAGMTKTVMDLAAPHKDLELPEFLAAFEKSEKVAELQKAVAELAERFPLDF